MKNRVVVTIAGQDFTLLSDRDERFIARVVERVDGEIMSIASRMPGSSSHIAVLAAINMAEEAILAQETAESLRGQMKDFLEESARLKNEIAELKRENTRLKKG